MDPAAKRNVLVHCAYGALVLGLCYGTARWILPWFWPFWMGLALAYLFRHLSAPIVRRLRLRGKPVAAAIALLFYGGIVLLFWTAAVLLAGRLVETASGFPLFYRERLLPVADRLGDTLVGVLGRLAPASAMTVNELFQWISASMGEIVSGISASLLAGVSEWLRKLPTVLIGFVFMLLSSFYIAMDYPRVTGFLLRQIPPTFRAGALGIKDFLVSCLLKMIRAYLLLMLLTFAELAVGLWALGVEEGWKPAALIALLDVLPLIGSGMALVPWGLYHLLAGNYPLGLGLIALYGVITVVRNLLEPRIVGDQLGLHPVVTLVAMFFGLRVLGVGGLLAGPVVALLLRYLNTTGLARLYR